MIDCLYNCFKHWSDGGSVYILSDPHFDDEDCKLMDPDWPTTEEQISILKQYVHRNDTLIVLGDIGDPTYMTQLKCHKVLIKGNHDKGSSNYKEFFDEIYDGPLFIADRVLLSHERIELPFCVNIHGHEHDGKLLRVNEDDIISCINVASNVVRWHPINLGNLIKNGLLSEIPTIHRLATDMQILKSKLKERNN